MTSVVFSFIFYCILSCLVLSSLSSSPLSLSLSSFFFFSLSLSVCLRVMCVMFCCVVCGGVWWCVVLCGGVCCCVLVCVGVVCMCGVWWCVVVSGVCVVCVVVCGGVCCVVLCCVVLCCVVLCCGVVWCGVVWHAEKPRVQIQNASVCTFKNVPEYAGNTRTSSKECARVAGTHGGVLNAHTEGHRQFCLPRKAHVEFSLGPRGSPKNPWILHNASLRTDREQHVPDSSNHSLYLMKLLSSSYPEETLEGTSFEMARFVYRSCWHQASSSFLKRFEFLLIPITTNMIGDGGREKTLYHKKGR